MPREKFQEKGASALTDEELVAAILGTEATGVGVRTIARQVAGLRRGIAKYRAATSAIHSARPLAWPRSSLARGSGLSNE